MNSGIVNLTDKPDGYFEGSRAEMMKYVPQNIKRTLEFGCGTGSFSALVKVRSGAETWAVEIDSNAAGEAAKKIDKVIVSDANAAIGELANHYFDCIFFFDILEHIGDPYSLLENVKTKLTEDGVIISSIPNIRYYRHFTEYVLHGNWDYKDAGTLDKTHLRFFTLKSIVKMFEQLGYEILTIEGIHATRNKKLKFLNFLLFGALEDLKYLQFAVVVKPKDTRDRIK